MKHNNVLPNAHFHKDWQRYVKTWFDQPARKQSRRLHRAAVAAKIAPRPLNSLRPVVRGQTIRYNTKVRAGRGFTIDELRAAKINRNEARGIGIAVDHRRKNRSEEELQLNVARLKTYKSKLVLFPRKPTSKKLRKGDATKEEVKSAKQVLGEVFPAVVPQPRSKARVIKPAEREASAYGILRKARTDSKLWGQRERRKLKKDQEKAGKKKKDDAEGDE